MQLLRAIELLDRERALALLGKDDAVLPECACCRGVLRVIRERRTGDRRTEGERQDGWGKSLHARDASMTPREKTPGKPAASRPASASLALLARLAAGG